MAIKKSKKSLRQQAEKVGAFLLITTIKMRSYKNN